MQLYLPGDEFMLDGRPPPPGEGDGENGPGYFDMQLRREWIASGGGPTIGDFIGSSHVSTTAADAQVLRTHHGLAGWTPASLPGQGPEAQAGVHPVARAESEPTLESTTVATQDLPQGSGLSPQGSFEQVLESEPRPAPGLRVPSFGALAAEHLPPHDARPVSQVIEPADSRMPALQRAATGANLVNPARIGVFEVGSPSGSARPMDLFQPTALSTLPSRIAGTHLQASLAQGAPIDGSGRPGGGGAGGAGAAGVLPPKFLVAMPRRNEKCEMGPIEKARLIKQEVSFFTPTIPSKENAPQEFTGTQIAGEFNALPCEPVPLTLAVRDLYQYSFPCGCGETCPRYVPSLAPTEQAQAFAAPTKVKWTIAGSVGVDGCFAFRTASNSPCRSAATPGGTGFSEMPLPTALYKPPPLSLSATSPTNKRQVVLNIEVSPVAGSPVALSDYKSAPQPLKFKLTLNMNRQVGSKNFGFQDVYHYKWTLALVPEHKLVSGPALKSSDCGCDDSHVLTGSSVKIGTMAVASPTPKPATLEAPGTFVFHVEATDKQRLNYACDPTGLCETGASDKRDHHELLEYEWSVTDSRTRKPVGVFPLGNDGSSVAWRPPTRLLRIAGNPRGLDPLDSPTKSISLKVEVRVRNPRANPPVWKMATSTFALTQRHVPMMVYVIHGAGPEQAYLTDSVLKYICGWLWPNTTVEVLDGAPGNILPADMGLRIANDIVQRLISGGPAQGIILVGHSLGGSAATIAANVLASHGIGVDDILLFDRYFSAAQHLLGHLGPRGKDQANLTPAAQKDVVRLYHVVADPNARTDLGTGITTAVGGGTRPTLPGRWKMSPIRSRKDHVGALSTDSAYQRIPMLWRGTETRMPLVPVNACRANLTRGALRSIKQKIEAAGRAVTGNTPWDSRLNKFALPKRYPC